MVIQNVFKANTHDKCIMGVCFMFERCVSFEMLSLNHSSQIVITRGRLCYSFKHRGVYFCIGTVAVNRWVFATHWPHVRR